MHTTTHRFAHHHAFDKPVSQHWYMSALKQFIQDSKPGPLHSESHTLFVSPPREDHGILWIDLKFCWQHITIMITDSQLILHIVWTDRDNCSKRLPYVSSDYVVMKKPLLMSWISTYKHRLWVFENCATDAKDISHTTQASYVLMVIIHCKGGLFVALLIIACPKIDYYLLC